MLTMKCSRICLLKIKPSLRRYSSISVEESLKDKTGLHKIETSFTNPMKLFGQWFEEHIGDNHDDQFHKVCCLSTASKNGDISSRSLILRRLDEDGFVVYTDGRSLKSKNIAENPQAALVFLWNKVISNNNFTRQVRIKGQVKKLDDEDSNTIFNSEPLFGKIRSLICNQGQPVSWDELKEKHDKVLERYVSNNDVLGSRPDYNVSYKIIPQYMDFYEVLGAKIADRLLFTQTEGSWNVTRIAA